MINLLYLEMVSQAVPSARGGADMNIFQRRGRGVGASAPRPRLRVPSRSGRLNPIPPILSMLLFTYVADKRGAPIGRPYTGRSTMPRELVDGMFRRRGFT